MDREIIILAFGRYSEEGAIIGRLLAGYGELELEICNCVAAVTDDIDGALRTLFGIRGAEKRIEKADGIMRASYGSAGLEPKYVAVMDAIEWCRKVRNQYAHCHWYDTKDEGLCFVDLESIAKIKNHLLPLKLHRHAVDVPRSGSTNSDDAVSGISA